MPEETQTPAFSQLGLDPRLTQTLESLGFHTPTPIQAIAIPAALEEGDLIGIAQTGTGKTLAFGLPMVDRLLAKLARRALILAPTRELALQIEESIANVGRAFGIRPVVLIGGAPMGRQISHLRTRPRIIIATPGRLQDHLTQGTIKLDEVDLVVLDEADRMLDMGFAPAVRRILSSTPKERTTWLFSATMPAEVEKLSKEFMRTPRRLEVERQGTTAEKIQQELAVVDKEEKNALLENLLRENDGTILVFARTRHGARKIAKSVRFMGHTAAELHADRTLAQRRAALDGFKGGTYRVLVATDIAARGIDVKDIELVVNYDLPDNPEDYVHRIGRTGRAGASGRAITFAMPDQGKDVRDIERLIRQEIPRRPGEREFDRPAGRGNGGGNRPMAAPSSHPPRHRTGGAPGGGPRPFRPRPQGDSAQAGSDNRRPGPRVQR